MPMTPELAVGLFRYFTEEKWLLAKEDNQELYNLFQGKKYAGNIPEGTDDFFRQKIKTEYPNTNTYEKIINVQMLYLIFRAHRGMQQKYPEVWQRFTNEEYVKHLFLHPQHLAFLEKLMVAVVTEGQVTIRLQEIQHCFAELDISVLFSEASLPQKIEIVFDEEITPGNTRTSKAFLNVLIKHSVCPELTIAMAKPNMVSSVSETGEKILQIDYTPVLNLFREASFELSRLVFDYAKELNGQRARLFICAAVGKKDIPEALQFIAAQQVLWKLSPVEGDTLLNVYSNCPRILNFHGTAHSNIASLFRQKIIEERDLNQQIAKLRTVAAVKSIEGYKITPTERALIKGMTKLLAESRDTLAFAKQEVIESTLKVFENNIEEITPSRSREGFVIIDMSTEMPTTELWNLRKQKGRQDSNVENMPQNGQQSFIEMVVNRVYKTFGW